MTYERQKLKKDGEKAEKDRVGIDQGVDAPAGPLKWVSETGQRIAKVPQHEDLQQVSPLSFPIKHWDPLLS